MIMDNSLETYIEMAMELGAEHAICVRTDRIFFDSRTYLKCMYGCHGGLPETLCSSQPGRIKPWEYEEMLKRYEYSLLLHFTPQKGRIAQKVALAVESKAFTDGYYFAFTLCDCDLCVDCFRFKGKECAFPLKARPSMHGAGIDVFKTVHSFGLPLETLSSPDEERNSYALIFFE